MKVLIVTDIKVIKCNNRLYLDGPFSIVFKRYSEFFEDISLCSRIKNEEKVSEKAEDITEIIKNFIPLKKLADIFKPQTINELKKEISASDMLIARVPSITAYVAADVARKLNKPYYTESMGCAWDAYCNHGIVGKTIAPYMFFKMKQTVKNADYALYVTSEFLQKRYPCKNESVAASNVLIEEINENILEKRYQKKFQKETDILTIMTTANTNIKYKGQEYVIRAIPLLNEAGIKVKYILVGGGSHTYLSEVAKKCGVESQVEFMGSLSHEEVFKVLDKTDIYLQPSLQEGLPRAVIEAMSRACPVIGARTAGIPELINDKWVVKRKSHKDIAKKIIELVNEDNMKIASKENFEESKKYIKDVLDEKRGKYFNKIKKELS